MAKINEEPESGEPLLDVEDTISRENLHEKFDLVILATGMVPNTADVKIPYKLQYDDYGFLNGNTDTAGIYSAGCARHPCDVSRSAKDGTAAALKAIQCLNRGE